MKLASVSGENSGENAAASTTEAGADGVFSVRDLPIQ
jgi:hypothetical protein